MTRIVLISDSHTKHELFSIPECDILIHAGDFSFTGKFFEIRDFLYWYGKQPAKHKVFIAGNHELTLDKTTSRYQESIHDMVTRDKDTIYLEDQAIELEGLKIYGTPWTPRFHDWAFNGLRANEAPYERGMALNDIYGQIPSNTNILVCHGPPFGILDQTLPGDERVGSAELLNRVDQLTELKLCVYGHIHEAYGQLEQDGIIHVNASSLDRDYITQHPPVVIEL